MFYRRGRLLTLIIAGLLLLGCATAPAPVTQVERATPTLQTEAPTPPPLPMPTAVPYEMEREVSNLLSPDGTWNAITLNTHFQGQVPTAGKFILRHTATQQEEVLKSVTPVPPETFIARVPVPILWSADSKVLYYSYISDTNTELGCQAPIPYPLYRYTLATAEDEALSAPVGTHYWQATHEGTIAYLSGMPNEEPPTLALYNPTADSIQLVPFPLVDEALPATASVEGELRWHPERNLLALSVTFARCIDPVNALFVFNADTAEMTAVASGAPNGYFLDRWYENRLVLWENSQFYDVDAAQWVDWADAEPLDIPLPPIPSLLATPTPPS